MTQAPAHYPVCLDLQGKPVLVVGGGTVATRKVQNLLKFGARVTVVSPEFSNAIRKLAKRKKVRAITSPYSSKVLNGTELAIAATDDNNINRAISRDCKKRRILVNVIDQPELCTFIAPAIMKRGSLVIAISTAGAGPMLARLIREKLQKMFGNEYAALLRAMAARRKKVQKTLGTMQQKRNYWRKFIKEWGINGTT